MIIGLTLISQAVLTIDTVNNKVLFAKHPVCDEMACEKIKSNSELNVDSAVSQLMAIDLCDGVCEDIQSEYRYRVENMVKSYVPAKNRFIVESASVSASA